LQLNLGTIIRKNSIGITLNKDSIYSEVTTNFDDKYGLGVAYNKDGIVAGGSVSKADEGWQYGLGAGAV
jgi:hypothetical protein